MIKNFLLDLIFPRFCLGCQKELNLKQASFICEACLNNISLNSGAECRICGLRNKNGTCQKCRKKTFLNGLFAAGKYQDPVLKEAIHQFKYQSLKSLKKPLAGLLINYIKKENLKELLSSPVLTPIPLTWSRKLKRGFNQSELLAKELSLVFNWPIINLLKRQKSGPPQARIKDWQARKKNISGAFCLNSKFFNYPQLIPEMIDSGNQSKQCKKVILVDDVSTSGATLEEAARVLKEAGVKEIYGLVIAKG